jgi:hypothetical protein
LAVYDGNQVKLYEFDKQDSHAYRSKKCDNAAQSLSSLHVYNMDDPDTGERSFLLIGVSTTLKKISTWHLIPNGTCLDIVYRGTKDMSWAVDPVVVSSASQWATNTASKLFHRLALQKKVVLVVSLGTDIMFYNVKTDKSDIEWEALFTLDTTQLSASIQKIKCGPGIVAIVSGDDRKSLSIWMEMRAGVAPSCVQTFEFQ